MAQQNVVITKKRRQNLCKASAGDITLPTIVGMAFGDGGVDSGGNVITPSDNQSALNNQLLRKACDSHTMVDNSVCRYVCTLSEAQLAGESISEIGLYDSAGDIVIIKNFPAKGKGSDEQMTFTLDDTF